MRLGSKCKQEVSREAAEELLLELNRFVDFLETKDIETKTVIAPYPPALPMVVPVLESATYSGCRELAWSRL